LKSTFTRLKSQPLSKAERSTASASKRLAKRRMAPKLPVFPVGDEILMIDDRARIRPAQAIETKLTRLLEDAVVPVSQLQMKGLLKLR